MKCCNYEWDGNNQRFTKKQTYSLNEYNDSIDKRWDIRWSSANIRFSNNIAEGWIHDVVHSDLGYASAYYSTDNENMMKDWGTRTSQEGFPNWDWL